jgi:hypothetical protein
VRVQAVEETLPEPVNSVEEDDDRSVEDVILSCVRRRSSAGFPVDCRQIVYRVISFADQDPLMRCEDLCWVAAEAGKALLIKTPGI